MVRAIVDGRKAQTRRPLKTGQGCFYPAGYEYVKTDRIWKFPRGNWSIPRKNDDMYHALFRSDNWASSTTALLPPYQVGDVLWVRETWGDYGDDAQYYYRADYPDGAKTYEWPELDEFEEKIICDLPKWRPSIHMPKEAARIFLKVTGIRVERVQDITEEDALKEGFSDRLEFGAAWNSIYNNWNENPYVWVIEFERCNKP